MNKAKYTPGQWAHHGPGSMRICDGRHESAEGCKTIAEAEIIGASREEAEANARLIAAAPELLKALKETVSIPYFSCCEEPCEACSTIVALIARVQGA